MTKFHRTFLRQHRRDEYLNNVQQWVLVINVGPKNCRKQSDICHKSVRKLSIAKICQKSVRNVSEFYQKTVRCKYLSEIHRKKFRNPSEMCQILQIDVKVQCCIGRDFLLLALLEYKRGSNCQVFAISLYQIFQKYCFRSFVAFKMYIKIDMQDLIDNSNRF